MITESPDFYLVQCSKCEDEHNFEELFYGVCKNCIEKEKKKLHDDYIDSLIREAKK